MRSQHRKDSFVTGSLPKNLKPKPFWSNNSTCFCPITRWLWAWSAGRFKFQRGNRLGVDVAEMVMKLKRKKTRMFGNAKHIYHVWVSQFLPKMWGFPQTNLWVSPKPVDSYSIWENPSPRKDLWELWWVATVMRNGCTMRPAAWNFEVPKF